MLPLSRICFGTGGVELKAAAVADVFVTEVLMGPLLLLLSTLHHPTSSLPSVPSAAAVAGAAA